MGSSCSRVQAEEPVTVKPSLAYENDDDETLDSSGDTNLLTEELKASLKELGNVVSSELASGVLSQLWPQIAKAAAKVMNDVMESALNGVAEKYPMLKRFVQARNLDLGTVSPQIGAIYSYKKREDGVGNAGIEICAELCWDADVDVDLTLGPASFGIDQVKMSGLGCIVLTPLLEQEPIVGGVHVFFVNTPHIDLKFKGLGGLSELNAVDSLLESKIKTELWKEMVLPNRKTIRMASTAITDMSEFRCPRPLGVFRVFVVKAANLPFGDFQADGSKSSDPFCKLKLGGRVGKTRRKCKTQNPSWEGDGPMDFLVHHERQLLELNVFDYDHVKWNDHLGHLPLHHTVKSLVDLQTEVGPDQLINLKLDCSKVPESWGGGLKCNASVYLKVQFFRFENNRQIQGTDDCKTGDTADSNGFQESIENIQTSSAGDVALLCVKLYHTTGFSEKDVRKAQVRLSTGGIHVLSRPCRKILLGDLYGFGKTNTTIMCKLHQEGVTPETIAKCFGLQEEIVRELVTLPSGEGIGWNETLYTLVYDCAHSNATATLELSLEGRQIRLGPPKELSSLFTSNHTDGPVTAESDKSLATHHKTQRKSNWSGNMEQAEGVENRQLTVGVLWRLHRVAQFPVTLT